MDTAPVGHLVNKVCFAPAGENLMFYNSPDTVYFINTDYEFVAKRSMMPWNRKGIAPSMGSGGNSKNCIRIKITVSYPVSI